MLLAGQPVERISEAGVEIDLRDNRRRQQQDHQGLRENPLALKAERQHESREQRHKRDRPQRIERALQRRRAALRQQRAPRHLYDDHGDDDIQRQRRPWHADGGKSEHSPTMGAKATIMMASLSAT
jgi:hypothetical protein